MGLRRDPAHITWKISIPSVARFVLLSTPCITFKGQLANVPLIKLTATQMARKPNAFSTYPKTPELEVKPSIRCKNLSAGIGIFGVSSDLIKAFLQLLAGPMLWFP